MSRQEKIREGLFIRHGYSFQSKELPAVPHFSPLSNLLTPADPVLLTRAVREGHPIWSHHRFGGTASMKRQTSRILGMTKLTTPDSVICFNPEAGNMHYSRNLSGSSRRREISKRYLGLRKPSNEVWEKFLV